MHGMKLDEPETQQHNPCGRENVVRWLRPVLPGKLQASWMPTQTNSGVDGSGGRCGTTVEIAKKRSVVKRTRFSAGGRGALCATNRRHYLVRSGHMLRVSLAGAPAVQ
ncbi:MAG: hypothetical protein CMJ75_06955 [Planctomycetaceae bacterium]|nr:hypothetical protein [Planctomycetaceae bacterium]